MSTSALNALFLLLAHAEDMLVTPKLAATIAKHSGLRWSMLLMAARTCTMWLNATMFTLYLSEHCHRGWTRRDPWLSLLLAGQVVDGVRCKLCRPPDLQHQPWRTAAARAAKGLMHLGRGVA